MSSEQQAFLCVADITGYTGYLNASELEHARGTLTDLLGVLVDHAGPPMRISKLEGDAVFSYAFENAFTDGRTFLDLIEATYVAFRRAIDSMVLNNTCQCNACANVSSLDLKFVIHFGSFVVQKVGTYDELLGPDVNLVHRLLKNTVVERLGISAYCLYTEPASQRLGFEAVTGLVPHDEDVADFGVVRTYVQDLADVYHSDDEEEITLDPSNVWFTMEADLPMPPAVVWDYMASPLYRNILIGSTRQEVKDLVGGRVGVGSAYQCYHGDRLTPQRIVEWKPFTKIVTKDGFSNSWMGIMTVIYTLRETPNGTQLSSDLGGLKDRPPWVRATLRTMAPIFRRKQTRALADFVDTVTRDFENRHTSFGNGGSELPDPQTV
jgi:hypothetical protein